MVNREILEAVALDQNNAAMVVSTHQAAVIGLSVTLRNMARQNPGLETWTNGPFPHAGGWDYFEINFSHPIPGRAEDAANELAEIIGPIPLRRPK